MTQEEFIKEIKDQYPQYGNQQLTDREWQLIETVYAFHPSIASKSRMAFLYLNYGMAAIADMYLRAVKIRDMQRDMDTLEAKMERMNRIYNDFDNAKSIVIPWEDLNE